jgi:branched-chain amino acid aminotransferase
LLDLVARTGLRDAYVSMMVTRGWSPSGSRDLRTYANQFYAYVLPFVWVFSPEQQRAGVQAVVSPVERISERAVDPRVKNYHWGDLIRATWDATDRGNETGILLDRYANVTEGPGFNVFAVVDGVLRTPKNGCLLGITRQTVLEIADRQGIPALVGDLPVADLRSAQEIFFTTTAGGVMPARTLDGRSIGERFPGPVTSILHERYWELHADPRYATEVDYA